MEEQSKASPGTGSTAPETLPEQSPGTLPDSVRDESTLSIVAIGASAGGLEALQELFDALPEDTGAAYVVVQHLSRDFRSLMDELLGRRTNMPVQVAEEAMQLRPNHVYLIPAGKDMVVVQDVVHLVDQRKTGLHLPIDHFLRSLAQNSHADAYAVILSGSGSDGARGIRDIKEQGGVVLVQSPESAKFDSMPSSALRTGLVDAALSPEHLARQLAVLLRGTPEGVVPTLVDVPEAEDGESTYERLLKYLSRTKGVDFRDYKPGTISRRIERRALINSKRTLESYLEVLTGSSAELDSLFHELLIGVTSFFRDLQAYEALKEKLRARLGEWAPELGPFRAWVCACSTGEEAYTIAMLLDEVTRELPEPLEFKVFATDVSPQAVSIAGQGLYPASIEADIPPHLLAKFFAREDDSYRVLPRIRERVIFAVHDIAVDAPFTRMDLVTCRNMLIYFKRELQERVTSLLHFALRASGILMLGPSESLVTLKSEFEALNHRWKIYRKRYEGRSAPMLHGFTNTDSRRGENKRSAPWPEPRDRSQNLVGDLFTSLFSKYVEAGFVFDDQQKLVYSFGLVEKYTRLPQGLVRLDSLSIIVDGLKSPMMLAIRQAQSSGNDVTLRNVEVKVSESASRVDIRVFRIETKGHPSSLFVAVIEDSRPSATVSSEQMDADEVSQGRIEELEHELASTKESLQAAIEELETSNEEMQSTNEELVASNEELQSTNEELQSVNEELHTINTEYQNKITELTEISADLEEFLNVADIGTVFLDSDLCIRKYTPAVREAIPIREHDLGRPITDLGDNLVDLDLPALVRSTLNRGTAIDREIRTTRGRRFYLRIRPHSLQQGVPMGILLAFVDMTSEDIAREDSMRVQAFLDLMISSGGGVGCWSYDLDEARFDYVSDSLGRLWGIENSELFENPELWLDAVHESDRTRCRSAFAQLSEGKDFSLLHRVRPRSPRWVVTTAQVMERRRGRHRFAFGISKDVTLTAEIENADVAVSAISNESTVNLLLDGLGKAPHGALLVGATGEIRFANGAAASALGVEPAQLIETNLKSRLDTPAALESVLNGRSHAQKLRLELADPGARIETSIVHLPHFDPDGDAVLLWFEAGK